MGERRVGRERRAGHGLMYQDPQGLAAGVVSFLAVTPGG